MTGSRKATRMRPGVLVTRPESAAATLCARLRRMGYRTWSFAAISIRTPRDCRALERAAAAIDRYTDLVVASRAAAHAIAAALRRAGRPPERLAATSVVAVGPGTAQALREVGFARVRVPARAAGRHLVGAFRRDGDLRGRRVLLPAAEGGRLEILEGLRALGARVDRVVAYRTVPARRMPRAIRSALDRGRIAVVIFASPSAVTAFARTSGRRRLERVADSVIAVAIGPTTREALEAAGFRRVVQSACTSRSALVAAVETAARRIETPSRRARPRALRAAPGSIDKPKTRS